MTTSKQIPYAALCKASCVNKQTDSYYIRFPASCSKYMLGARKCYVMKTDGTKYIIVQPITDPKSEDKPWTLTLAREKDAEAIRICVTGKVNSGFLPSRIFGAKYKIKRRAKNGAIYICLDEPIEEGNA